ncbi:MAG: IgGFc-binding protein, partial [bacterium]|nr:IgGFc-binding protein [Candidatus Kapabacteria bacterium]
MNGFSLIPRSLLSALAVALLIAVPAHSQNASVLAPAGTEYFVGFMQNDDELSGANARFMGLLITSQVATVGSVEIPGRDATPFSVRPGEFYSISIPRAFEHTISEDTIGNGTQSIIAAIRVTSRAPVSVFVVNARNQTTAGYPAVPVSHWGRHYLPLTLPNSLGTRTSELMIISAYDDTYVRFTPRATTVRQDRGDVREIKLDRGRTYFVQALANMAGVNTADLSGSEIVATNPIGVVSGHVRTTITR